MANNQDLLTQIFEIIMAVRIVAFFVFILMNIYDLDQVSYDLALPGYDSTAGSFSFYNMVGILAVIFALVLLFSIGIFGIGLNTAGTYTIIRYVSYMFLWIILGLGLTYFLQFEPAMSFVIEIISTIVFVLYMVTTNVKKRSTVDE